MSNWYEEHRKYVISQAEKVRPKEEIDQSILRLKAIGYEAFKSHPDCYSKEGMFSERMVNQLMQYAYDQGRKDIDKRSYDIGYENAREEMKEMLS